jgi:predicted nucleic acid-binding protein
VSENRESEILGCALLTLDRRLAAGAPAGVPVTVV